MGYAYYLLPDGREAGYGVEAECDRAGCAARIDRGLGYLCGQNPEGHKDADEPGCGKYFCPTHQPDHDCTNPECGEWDEGENLCCRLVRGHDLPHRDTDTEEEFVSRGDDVKRPAYFVDIARVCHEANRAIQMILCDPAVSPGWDDAPEWQRESAIDGVEKAINGATSEQLHESWCEYKRADGWTYGETKDEVAKTHPCLVPYDELPETQRRKDAVFGAIVAALTS